MLGMQRGLGITQECNVRNVFFGSYSKKNQRKKATGRNREKAARYCDRKQFFLKVLLQKMLKIITESSSASLIVTVEATADLPAGNLQQHEKLHAIPLSSLPDYIFFICKLH